MRKILKPVLGLLLAALLHAILLCEYTIKVDAAEDLQNVTNLAVNANNLEDGAVYFIRSKVDTTKVMDVKSANYTQGNNIILFNQTGWGNQRFVLEKSFQNTYRIKPLDAPNTYLAVAGNNNSSGANIVLRSDYSYNDSLLLTDRFLIEQTNSGDAYIIKTSISSNEKCIALKNNNMDNGNQLVQKENSNTPYCEWVFDKTDTLGVNVENEVYFPANSSKKFLLTAPYKLNYFIETKHSTLINSQIELREDNSDLTLIMQTSGNAVGFNGSVLSYCPNTGCTYIVIVKNKSNTAGYIRVGLRPEKPVYLDGIYDIGQNKSDRLTQLINTRGRWIDYGYYPFFRANMPASSIKETGINGKVLMNNDYYFFRGHGNPGGAAYYNGTNSSGGWIDVTNMPNLSKTKLVFWGTCSGAKMSVNHNGSGITSSLARQSVVKGSQYGMGWTESILTDHANTWCEHFINSLTSGTSVLNASKIATDLTKDDEWWDIFWGNDSITKPIVYSRLANNQIVWYKAWLDNPAPQSDSIYPDASTNLKSSNEITYVNKDYHEQIIGGKVEKFLIYNGIPTNINYCAETKEMVKNFFSTIRSLKTIRINSGDETREGIFLTQEGLKHICSIYSSDKVTVKYVDCETGEEISHSDFINMSRLRRLNNV